MTKEKNNQSRNSIGRKSKDAHLPDGWHYLSLTDVCEIIVSPVDKKSVDGESQVKLCNYTDVYYNHSIDSKINFMDATATSREIEKFSIFKDDVVITKDSETPNDIGVPAYIEESIDKLLCGYHLTICRPIKGTIIGKYLLYALTLEETKYNFYRFASGVTRFALTTESYSKIKIPLPPLAEQEAIVSLLDNWDRAIEKTDKLVTIWKAQLEGLVQKLVSGEQRLRNE